tara:strand:+ start:4088 stop:4798 length:711 start_codon:yes stop_codon:yes gene_type:complete
MATETVEALIEGGKASAAPPLGPALGPMGVNIGEVVSAINEKTAAFKGMQVPVKVNIDTSTKEFTIEIGTPPAASLIKKEAQVKKGASNPLTEKVADLLIEQIIKIAKMKEDALTGKDMKMKVREIVGTCQSMGVLVEGVPAQEALKKIEGGEFDEEIKAEKTEISEEEQKQLDEERKKMQAELEEKRTEFESQAKTILSAMEGKDTKAKRGKLAEAGIPQPIIDELAPIEKEVVA